jgi:hypothetical protein
MDATNQKHKFQSVGTCSLLFFLLFR